MKRFEKLPLLYPLTPPPTPPSHCLAKAFICQITVLIGNYQNQNQGKLHPSLKRGYKVCQHLSTLQLKGGTIHNIPAFNLDVYYKQILEILRSPNFEDQNFSTNTGGGVRQPIFLVFVGQFSRMIYFYISQYFPRQDMSNQGQ